MSGFQFDRKHPDISETIASIQINQKNIRSGEAKELLKEDIINIIDAIPEDKNDFRGIRDKALILIGFVGFIICEIRIKISFVLFLDYLNPQFNYLLTFHISKQI